MAFILKEDMATHKICPDLLAISLLKNNFFDATALLRTY